MDAEKRTKIIRISYLAAAVVLAAVLFGLFGLPFFRMDGQFVSDAYAPDADSAFTLMGSTLHPELFRYSENQTSFNRNVNEILGLYYAGGVMYWLMLLGVAAVLVLAALSLLKKKTLPLSIAYCALTAVSFAALVLFGIMAKRANALYQTFLGVGFTPYRFFSGAYVLFGLSAAGFLGAVLTEQLAIYRREPFFGAKRAVFETPEREEYYTEGEETRVLFFQGEREGIAKSEPIPAPRGNAGVGIKNAASVALGDTMPDVIRKVGLPVYVDEQLNAYWWRSARTRTEYLVGKLADAPDCELKISFGKDKTVDRIVLNANGGSFATKNVKEQTVGEKKAYYGQDAAAELGAAEVLFYDGSYVRLAEPNYRIPVAEPGLAEVFWEFDGLTFSDRITIK